LGWKKFDLGSQFFTYVSKFSIPRKKKKQLLGMLKRKWQIKSCLKRSMAKFFVNFREKLPLTVCLIMLEISGSLFRFCRRVVKTNSD